MMNKLINYFIKRQKTLFLIDSIGAITTAFFLFVIMRKFNMFFGMPKPVLTYLAAIAICFCVYSIACFLFLKGGCTPFIRLIGIANLLYCASTIGLLIKYFPLITIIGTIYFLLEITIICGLSYIELNTARRSKEKQFR